MSRAQFTDASAPVIALHPEVDGKPAVVGNCQAGWAVMMVAARRPELFGPTFGLRIRGRGKAVDGYGEGLSQ